MRKVGGWRAAVAPAENGIKDKRHAGRMADQEGT